MAAPHRTLVSHLALILALTLVAGCGGAEAGPPVLKFATWFGASEAKELAPIVQAINARHQGEFVLEPIAIPGEYMTKVDTMMAGKLAPDLFLLSQEFVPSYAAVGAIADLDAKIKADPSIDLPDYYPASLKTARYQDHFYGLPILTMPVVMYYNKGMFDAAHEPYPTRDWDWAGFRAAAKRLTQHKPDGQAIQWGFLQHTWPPYMIWVWQNGGDVMTPAGQPTLSSPEAVEALHFMRDLVVTDKVSPGAGTVSQNGANELFKSGRIAMFFGGASDDLDRVPGLDVGVTELPHGKARATFSWMAHLVISPQSKHQAIAYTAWRELLEGFHHWKIVPPRRSLAKHMAAMDPHKAAAAGAILASLEYAHGLQGVVEQTEWNDFVLNELLLPVLGGRATAEDATALTQRKLSRLQELTTP